MLRFVALVDAVMVQRLADLCARAHDGLSVQWIMDARNRGDVALWEVPGCGLVLTKIINRPSGLELFLLGVSGRGMLKHGSAIKADLETIAREYGCKTLGAQGRKGWRRLAEAIGYKEVAICYQAEIK